MTEYHDYHTPQRGERNWHQPLNENFRQIDGDIEIRDTEANLDTYSPSAGSKFLATDTGRRYISDGDGWRLLPVVGGAKAPQIVCFDDGNQAYAETVAETFTGDCVFDAAQQAVNSQISDEPTDVHVLFQPGEYELTTGLTLNDSGLRRVLIRSPDWGQVKLRTDEITDSSSAIEINPGPVAKNDAQDRPRNVIVEGFELDDIARSGREINGIYLNDCQQGVVRNCTIKNGFKRALWIRNIWQGVVDTIQVSYCGSDGAGVPAIQVGAHDETNTYQATNHIQFNHLQGQADEYAYFEARGTATRIDITFPNAEFLQLPGFVFDGRDGNLRVQIRGAELTGGEPAIAVRGAARLRVTGGNIEADGRALQDIDSENLSKILVGGGVRLSGGSTSAVVDIANSWVNMSGFRVENGNRGIDLSGCQIANVTGGIIRNCARAGLKSSDMAGVGAVYSNLLIDAASDGESPVYLENVDNAVIGNLLCYTNSDVPAVRLGGCENISVSDVIPSGAATTAIDNKYGSSFRRNKGTVTLPSGSTRVTVSHKLAGTPTAGDIMLTPASDPGNVSSWYVTEVDDDTFDIAVDTAPTSQIEFGWQGSL